MLTYFFSKALLRIRSFQFSRRQDHLLQSAHGQCGLICADIVNLLVHGSRIEGERLALHRVEASGTSFSTLVGLLEGQQIDVMGIEFSLNRIYELPRPTILHYSRGHFVVLRDIFLNFAFISDPAIGSDILPLAQLVKRLSGMAIIICPAR